MGIHDDSEEITSGHHGKSMDIPSGYDLHSHGKSPCLIGKPSINGRFSMAMLNHQRVFSDKNSYSWCFLLE